MKNTIAFSGIECKKYISEFVKPKHYGYGRKDTDCCMDSNRSGNYDRMTFLWSDSMGSDGAWKTWILKEPKFCKCRLDWNWFSFRSTMSCVIPPLCSSNLTVFEGVQNEMWIWIDPGADRMDKYVKPLCTSNIAKKRSWTCPDELRRRLSEKLHEVRPTSKRDTRAPQWVDHVLQTWRGRAGHKTSLQLAVIERQG